jgi:hypothetical protein
MLDELVEMVTARKERRMACPQVLDAAMDSFTGGVLTDG